DREYRAALTEAIAHEFGDGGDRPAILHQFSEQRAEQKQRKELRQEGGGAAHEDLRPTRQQREAGEDRGNQRTGGREQQHTPAPIGEPDQQGEAGQDAEKSHAHRPSSSRSRSTEERLPRSS